MHGGKTQEELEEIRVADNKRNTKSRHAKTTWLMCGIDGCQHTTKHSSDMRKHQRRRHPLPAVEVAAAATGERAAKRARTSSTSGDLKGQLARFPDA